MLSRRIPLIQTSSSHPPAPPSKQQASAIPLHLQRSGSLAGGTPPRPRSPQLSQRPGSPPAPPTGTVPYRPGSPFRNRVSGVPPGIQPSTGPLSPNPASLRKEDVEVDLIVRNIPRDDIRIEKPFTVAFTLNVSAPVPIPRPQETSSSRILSIVVQHIEPVRRSSTSMQSSSAPLTSKNEPYSPRVPSSGLSTPSPYGTPHRVDFQDFLSQRLLVASPRRSNMDEDDAQTDTDGGGETPAPPDARIGSAAIVLPPPFSQIEPSPQKVVYLGNSALFLPQLRLTPPSDPIDTPARFPTHERNISSASTDSEADSELGEVTGTPSVKLLASQDFELTYMPLKRGFTTFGGLRVVVVEDRLSLESRDHHRHETRQFTADLRILKEWDTVGEVWIGS